VADRSELNPAVFRLASAHFVSDAYTNIYAPLLPALIPRLHLTLAAAGTLAMLFQLAGSVSQMAFGPIADRWRPRVLLVAGPILSVAAMSLIGVARSPAILAAVLALGGLGSAAFHPTSAAVVNRIGGTRRGMAMSIHITGGSIGYALAPVLFAPYVQRFGLSWTPMLAIPGLAALSVVLRRMPHTRPLSAGSQTGYRILRPYARPLFLLWLIVVLRTIVSLSLATFVPVLLTRRGWSVGMAGAAVSVYLTAASIGGFAGGPLSDRFGSRRVIASSLVLSVPFLVVGTRLNDWPLVLMLALGGFFLQSTLPVNVTFAHQIAPVSAATVSSLMMGFAWGTGGLTAPFVGALADRIGIESTLTAVAILPLIGAACALPLPREGEADAADSARETAPPGT
jgi:FSR family fosmidomycin resistance protein-like MFS transporter